MRFREERLERREALVGVSAFSEEERSGDVDRRVPSAVRNRDTRFSMDDGDELDRSSSGWEARAGEPLGLLSEGIGMGRGAAALLRAALIVARSPRGAPAVRARAAGSRGGGKLPTAARGRRRRATAELSRASGAGGTQGARQCARRTASSVLPPRAATAWTGGDLKKFVVRLRVRDGRRDWPGALTRELIGSRDRFPDFRVCVLSTVRGGRCRDDGDGSLELSSSYVKA